MRCNWAPHGEWDKTQEALKSLSVAGPQAWSRHLQPSQQKSGVHAVRTFRAVKQGLEHLPLTCKHWVFLLCILRQKQNKFYYKLPNQKLEVERAICG